MAAFEESFSRKVFKVSNNVALICLAVACMVPLLNMLAMSLSDKLAVSMGKVGLWPVDFTLVAYEHVAGNSNFLRSFYNSAQVVVLGVSFNMLINVLGSYPMSRDDRVFKGRRFYVWFMIVTILFSGGLLPLFMAVNYTGLMDTIWALIIPGSVPVFAIFMLMHFFRGIPKEVEESAFIDGAGYMQTMVRIHIPMAKPAMATLVLFSFVGHWNEFFKGLIYLQNSDKWPLQTYLYTIQISPDMENRTLEEIRKYAQINPRSVTSAQIFVSLLPVMIVYPFLQKYFLKGIVLGSVKG